VRHDGLTVGQPVYVIQMFDTTGYYSSASAHTIEGVKARAARRAERVKGLVAMTVPFEGKWSGLTLNVSAPLDIREAFNEIDRPERDE
jgi:hypothetical protein